MNSKYAIESFSLTKTFSDWWGRAKVVAVDNLDLKIKYNEVYGLLGPNGSGKTTAIKMLLSLLHPTKGRSLVLGGDAGNTKINSKIGFLPEESYLYKYLTARETLDFYGKIFALPTKVRKTRIDALLDMVGLSAVANRPVGTFSKGMARRIGLAQALINDPELLILDEPTSGLDPIGTRQIKDLVIKLAQRGKTVLLCSHLLADVEDVCDRIGILYGGQMQCEGKVGDLLVQSHKKQIISEDLSDSAVEQIRQILEKENVKYNINSPMEKLETFFIDTVTTALKSQKATSGAISTTKIGDFLTDESQKSILDKLVSNQNQSEPQTQPTQKIDMPVVDVEDKQLLENLTEDKSNILSASTETEPVEPTPQPRQTDKSVLEELTAKGNEQNDSQGEQKDA